MWRLYGTNGHCNGRNELSGDAPRHYHCVVSFGQANSSLPVSVRSTLASGGGERFMKVESANYLRAVYKAICLGWGAPEHQAEAFADAILTGDLYGHAAQGMAITHLASVMVNDNQVNLTAEPTIEVEGPSFVALNANRCLGQYAMTRAMDMAIEKARDKAVGIAWIHNWHDIGCASAYTKRALDQSMVAMLSVNTVPLTAPYGGREMLMSAAPLSFVCPAGEHTSILADMALCEIYDFQMVEAARSGTRLDKKYLVDPDTGELTDDPAPYILYPEARSCGCTAATVFTGPKLYLVNILFEILTGMLTPGGFASHLNEYPTQDYLGKGKKIKRGGGGFLMAIDPSRLMAIETFKARVNEWIHTIKSSKLQAGVTEIFLPGERAQQKEQRYLREGVPVKEELWQYVVDIAEDTGVDLEALRD